MKKLVAIFIIFILILSSMPALAAKKAHPVSPFNIIGGWFSSLGKRADGTSIWEFEGKTQKSTLTHDEIRERRGKLGSGMRGKIED